MCVAAIYIIKLCARTAEEPGRLEFATGYLSNVRTNDLHQLLDFDVQFLHQPCVLGEIVSEKTGHLFDRTANGFQRL